MKITNLKLCGTFVQFSNLASKQVCGFWGTEAIRCNIFQQVYVERKTVTLTFLISDIQIGCARISWQTVYIFFYGQQCVKFHIYIFAIVVNKDLLHWEIKQKVGIAIYLMNDRSESDKYSYVFISVKAMFHLRHFSWGDVFEINEKNACFPLNGGKKIVYLLVR